MNIVNGKSNVHFAFAPTLERGPVRVDVYLVDENDDWKIPVYRFGL